MITISQFLKPILFVSLLFAFCDSKSQTLEHTYPTFPREVAYMQSFRVSETETLYARTNVDDGRVHIYNSAHVLIDSILPDTPARGLILTLVSRKLFDTDNDIELVLTGYNKGVFIVNQDGTIKFGERASAGPPSIGIAVSFLETDDGPKMMLVFNGGPTNTVTKIYDLENVVLGKNELSSKSPKRYSFPNPTGTLITIPNDGKQSTLAIYNVSGQLIDQRTISGDYIYDASNLTSGIYLYRINGEYAGKFIKE